MGRQGDKRQVGAARRRSRGHGLARLDGTRPRATVASKVMESGETAGHGNGRRDVQTARKRKRAGPDLAIRAEGVSRAERGNDGSPSGARLAQLGSMRSTTARPAMLLGRRRHESTDQQAIWHTVIKESFFQLLRDIDVLQKWQEDTKGRQPQERRKRARPLALGRARAQNALYIRR